MAKIDFDIKPGDLFECIYPFYVFKVKSHMFKLICKDIFILLNISTDKHFTFYDIKSKKNKKLTLLSKYGIIYTCFDLIGDCRYGVNPNNYFRKIS